MNDPSTLKLRRTGKTIILIGIIILIGFLTHVFLRKNTEGNTKKTTFVVGTATGYAPFVSINEKGGYEGFDIDVSRALAKELKKELIIKDLGSMTSLFLALENGSIDAIIWGLSITEERAQKINFRYNYREDKNKELLLCVHCV